MNNIKHFLKGWGSIYDLSPTIYNPYIDKNGKTKSTEQSLYEHWQAVGGYLQSAMRDFDNEQQQINKNNIQTTKSVAQCKTS